VYDSLKAQLLHKARGENPTSTVVKRLVSAVGVSVSEGSPLAKVEHTAEFGGALKSLASAHSAKQVRAWWDRNIVPNFRGVSTDELEVVLEPKVDGLTMRATYRNGSCIQVFSACMLSNNNCHFCC
jgi:NAD-dependent DNA ligase